MHYKKEQVKQYEHILTLDDDEKDWLWGLIAEAEDKKLLADWDYEPRKFFTDLKRTIT